MNISGIYALTNNSIVETNHIFTTNAVNIELKEYLIDGDNNGTVFDNEKTIVFPGSKISLISKIDNLGTSCYVRAKIELYFDSDKIANPENEFLNISDKWKQYGDYCYYDTIVNSGETVQIFSKISIPDNLSKKYVGKEIKLKITAEAVQSNNFKPNYTLDDPWNGLKVEKCVDNTYQFKQQSNLSSLTKIEYSNDANKYIELSNNFFSNLNNLLPGDSTEEIVKITNKTQNISEYFYYIDVSEGTANEEIKLLEKCNLVIVKNDTDIIYDDSLLNHKINSLGKLNPNEETKIKFIITMPEELDNEFSVLTTKFIWKFSVNTEGTKDNTNDNILKNIINNVISPKTGDFKFDLSIILFFVSAITLIIVLFLENRINKNKLK